MNKYYPFSSEREAFIAFNEVLDNTNYSDDIIPSVVFLLHDREGYYKAFENFLEYEASMADAYADID